MTTRGLYRWASKLSAGVWDGLDFDAVCLIKPAYESPIIVVPYRCNGMQNCTTYRTQKDGELRAYVMDFADWGANGNPITDATWIVPTGLTGVGEQKALPQTGIGISGGKVGRRYELVCRGSFQSGEILRFPIILEITA
jgi:hypothetical protein